ncbi:hypothetical protein DIPPA_32971 [Diplonema papillatum]|nr:hypothetical protein DIPPA_32971 [Diplonema papillatum]|eukprot:gene7841-12051_t
MPAERTVNIGCHSAMWGDTSLSAPQLLKSGDIEYLVGDYLAEVTMAILAKAHTSSGGTLGYATDFVSMVAANLPLIQKNKVKIVVNAGGVNPDGCRNAIAEVFKKANIPESQQPRVCTISGDNLLTSLTTEKLHEVVHKSHEMLLDTQHPAVESVLSSNAYLGAFPIAAALSEGYDIIITGRVADSALVLGPLIYEFNWQDDNYDALAAGTLAGHLVECGAQGTGGLFTDWDEVPNWETIGYPIVKVRRNGEFTLTKPAGTGGLLSVPAVAEQMLYEIGNPQAYFCPDVTCDFSEVIFSPTFCQDRKVTGIVVSNAKGRPPTSTYKACTTVMCGYMLAPILVIQGRRAVEKARKTASALLSRWEYLLKRHKFEPIADRRVEIIGTGGTRYGHMEEGGDDIREVVLRVAVRHDKKKPLNLIRREVMAAGVSMGQGTIGITRGLPSPGELIKCFSFLLPKTDLPYPCIDDVEHQAVPVKTDGGFDPACLHPHEPPAYTRPKSPFVHMTLDNLVYGRSGDKGDTANIGVISRKPEYVPFLAEYLTAARVKHFFEKRDCTGPVERFYLPGIGGFNFLLYGALGGGGTSSIHSDSLAKSFASVLLSMMVDAPAHWRLPEAAHM